MRAWCEKIINHPVPTFPMHPSVRVGSLQSAIMQDLQAHFTKDTISLAQGVPFFPPPAEALQELGIHLNDPIVHSYSPDAGLIELREALVRKLSIENGIHVEPGQVMVTAGANQAFVNAILTIADPGDEIILLRPYYFNHEMALRLAGIKPVIVDVDESYQPVPELIEEAITSWTKAVVTVSPNNPTGAVYGKRMLHAINTICNDHGIYHISDEPYEYFTFGDEHHHSPGAGNEEHTITLHSFSKTYGMSGWRIGYMSYPTHLEADLLKVQDTVVICPSVIGQRLAIECLKLGKEYLTPHLEMMRRSREVMLSHLRDLQDFLMVPETKGGYYFYARVVEPETNGGERGKGTGNRMDSHELAVQLIKQHDVAVVPGESFGSTNGRYLRLSYGNVRKEDVEEGMNRFSRGLRAICKSH